MEVPDSAGPLGFVAESFVYAMDREPALIDWIATDRAHQLRCQHQLGLAACDAAQLALAADVSQRISRKLWGPVTPCLTATSIIYDFWPDSVWTADAKLCIHGSLWRELQVASLSEEETDELCGQSMFAPNVGAIVLSFVLNAHAPWGSPGGESCQSQAAPAAGARQHARARR